MTKRVIRKAPEGSKRCKLYVEPNHLGYWNVLCAGSIVAPNIPREKDAVMFAASQEMYDFLKFLHTNIHPSAFGIMFGDKAWKQLDIIIRRIEEAE